MKKTLGGERLGSGKKIKVDLHNWGRSTFNQSRKWRSTMAPGVLIPCFTEIGLNGTTFNIDINTLAHTIPTIGPLFGSFKMQVDMFACPIRLYQGLLHNNMTNIGLNMSKVLLPKIIISDQEGETQKSSLLNYLGIKGVHSETYSEFNALTILMYYDIFKNYYANKQEEFAKVLTSNEIEILTKIIEFEGITDEVNDIILQEVNTNTWEFTGQYYLANDRNTTFKLIVDSNTINENAIINFYNTQNILVFSASLKDKGLVIYQKENYKGNVIGQVTKKEVEQNTEFIIYLNRFAGGPDAEDLASIAIGGNYDTSLMIQDFPLANIDEARKVILRNCEELDIVRIGNDSSEEINFAPYSTNCNWTSKGEMQGLVLKTYQSDMYTNWLNNDNVELINEISAVQVNSDNSFNIDALILAKKVHSMLNRIAVSGGTYEDWQEANYGEEVITRAESPIYIGGTSAEIQFDEVVSTAKSEDEPLATLAGKGILTDRKGGSVIYKCEEPTIIMGIVSITPRIDYADGNKWFMTEIDSMNDFHKPALDGIGFQNLMANNIHWRANGVLGKQTAWINYQTAVDEVFANFAKTDLQGDNQSYMVLKRQFEVNDEGDILDFTSYIDPSQYNYAFADNRLESQNFWVQIGFNVQSRRKMAAYEIPQL